VIGVFIEALLLGRPPFLRLAAISFREAASEPAALRRVKETECEAASHGGALTTPTDFVGRRTRIASGLNDLARNGQVR